jgi:ABC-type glycerol-3-phosphate transport system substrate-binding protein
MKEVGMTTSSGRVSRRLVLRTGTWLAAGAGVGAALAACAPSKGDSSPNPKNIAPTKLVAVLNATAPGETDLTAKAIQDFEAKFPQVTVDRVTPTADANYDVKTDTMIAAGTPPALWYPAKDRGYRYYAAAKKSDILDDLIARDKYDLTDFHPEPLAFSKWEGKYNSLPNAVNPTTLVWNETMFQSLGVSPPSQTWGDKAWSFDQFLSAAQKLTRKGSDLASSQYGAVMSTGSPSERIFGGDLFDDDAYLSGYPDPAKFPFNRAAVIQAWEFEQGLIHRHQVQPTSADSTALRGTLPNVFNTGKIGMFQTSASFAFSAAQIQGFKWRFAALPTPPTLPGNFWFFADQWVMMRGQPNRDAAWELLKHMMSPEALRSYQIGLGRIVPRKSLTAAWVSVIKERTGLSDADLKVPFDAISRMDITASHALVAHARIENEAIGPERAKIFNNITSPNAAIDAFSPVAVSIIRETNARK